MRTKSFAPAVALVLAACGGGGDSNDAPAPVAAAPAPAPSATPPGAAPAPTPPLTTPNPAAPNPAAAPPPVATPVPVQTPIAVPAPITAPVDPAPAPQPVPVPPPAGSPPAPTPPAPPPQPAAGTFILGSVVKEAVLQQTYTDFQAAEIDPKTGTPVQNGLRVTVNFYTSSSQYSQYTFPTNNQTGINSKYPYGASYFPVGYSNEGWFSLGRQILAYSYVNGQSQKESPLIRPEGDFEIRDDYKFIIDTTAAEWRGTERDPGAFIQLQIASYAGSDTVFALCQHQNFGDVRRKACTLHNKDTGQKRGVYVRDDSRGLGAIDYLPVQ